jgi:hypothetical protein
MLSSEKPVALRNEPERDTEAERAAAISTPEEAATLLEHVHQAAKIISAEGRFYEEPLQALHSSAQVEGR